MNVNLSINPKQAADGIVQFIKKTIHSTSFSRVVLGLSGGVDSSVVFALALKALGKNNVYPAILPYKDYDLEGFRLTEELIKTSTLSQGNIYKKNISEAIDKIALGSQINNIRLGNIIARVRMTIIYDKAKEINALVIGTENKTEHLLGYYTLHGDSASDIEPIRHLYKTQVKELAKFLEVPKKIIERIPTAGLWQGQTDEGEFGFSYKQADQILYLFIDKKETAEEIIGSGFKREIVEKVLYRAEKNRYKHILPYHLKENNL